ncbi:hypothetical protein [Microbacterium sp. NPDC056052]|uniref:hypothetical protein n=1 Tax=Microbacterium sp. NPDC056052 TaxID=3345695 RepID=UPI0035E14200
MAPRTLSTAYGAVHDRLRRERGRASAHPCATPGCDRPARDWAYNGSAPFVIGDVDGAPRTWGMNADQYEPRCRRCHLRMDLGGTIATCPNGHDRATHGTSGTGCAECSRIRARNRYRRNRMNAQAPDVAAAIQTLDFPDLVAFLDGLTFGAYAALVPHLTTTTIRRLFDHYAALETPA